MKHRKFSVGARVAALVLAAAIFAADSVATLNASVAILYLCVLAIIGFNGSKREIVVTGLACILLSTGSWLLVHSSIPDLASALRLGFVFIAIILTAALLINRLNLQSVQGKLEESEAELITFADSVPHLLWRSTADGQWDFLNRRFTEITGVEREEGIARQTWRECVHPDDLAALQERLVRSLETGEDISAKVRLRQKDGSYRWMSMARRAVRSPETGEILRFYGGSSDIHDEVLAQERIKELMATLEQRVEERTAELMRTEARYSSLFDVGNISFAEMDFSATLPILNELRQEGVSDLRRHMEEHPDLLARCLGLIRTTRVNEALATLMGYGSLAELAANPPVQNADDGPEVLLRQLEMAYYDIDHIDGRTVLIGKGGQRIPIYFTVNRLVSGLHISSHVDLSEQERVQELQRAAQDELARANRIATVGAYSATIAHELNQPIASISMDVQTSLRWLQAESPNPEAAVRGLERLTRTVDRVRGIIERTRENLIAHRRKVKRFDLCALASETRDLLEPVVRREGASLHLKCDREFPALEADPIELQQVLVNLITNAAEAMTDTDGERRIEFSVVNIAKGVHVTVSDTGPGIPPDRLDRLFEPFFTTKPSGMGMGLQVCRNAVESMGGTLRAANREEGGAVFCFVLPAMEEEAEAA